MIENLERLLNEMETNYGVSVSQLNAENDVLLVFLRFFGCTFCREAISDIAAIQSKLESYAVKLVFVHMARDPETPDTFFSRYQLSDVHHVTDQTSYFYAQFGLVKASQGQLMGFRNWVRGFQSAVIEGHGFTKPDDALGDVFQMPGVFVLRNGKVINQFIHRMPYDRPDYLSLVQSVGAK
jgi:hypothetical protein